MKHKIFDGRGVLAHEIDDGQPECEPPVRLQRVVRTTSPRCPKCEAESDAINHNAGNIPGIGYEEETQYKCKTCGHDWWS